MQFIKVICGIISLKNLVSRLGTNTTGKQQKHPPPVTISQALLEVYLATSFYNVFGIASEVMQAVTGFIS